MINLPGLPLLVVVEGIYDIHFLKAMSTLLHQDGLPNLGQLEADRAIIVLPTGGSNLKDWAMRIASFHKREFHLYDREQEPETNSRRQIVDSINQQPGCMARLTQKRAMENYLHPLAIFEACGLELTFDDDTDVPGLLALQLAAKSGGVAWRHLPLKSQRRFRERAKRVLNVAAVEHMTTELLAERDAHNEIAGWLRMIGKLLSSDLQTASAGRKIEPS